MNVKKPISITRILFKVIFYMVAFFLFLLITVWAASPLIVNKVLGNVLKKQGLILNDDSHVRYNPFLSQLTIKNFVLTTQTLSPFKIAKANIEVDLHKAINGDFVINTFKLDGLNISITNFDNNLNVAGFELSSQNTPEAEDKPEPTPAQTQVDQTHSNLPSRGLLFSELELTNSHFTYTDNTQTQAIYIQSLHILDGHIDAKQQSLTVKLDAQYNNAQINVTSNINFSDDERITTSDISIKGLDLTAFRAHLPEGLALKSGLFNLSLNSRATIDGENSSVKLTNLSVGLEALNVRQDTTEINLSREFITHINTLFYQNNELTIDRITLKNLGAQLHMHAATHDKTTLASGAQNETSHEKNADINTDKSDISDHTDQAPPLTFSIKSIAFADENKLSITDENVTPHYERTFHIDKATIEDIDNTKESHSPFEFLGRSNEYAKVNMAGDISLFSEKMNLNVAGGINEVSLPSISPYLKDAIGFELKSGQLDTDIDLKITQSIIEGRLDIHLRGLKMTAADSDIKSNIGTKVAMPLNMALGMLQDKQGNVKLNIPLKGRVDDPSFNPNSFLLLVTKKAAMSAGKSYLLKTFVPYANVVSVAMSATDYVLKLRFEDLPYPPQQSDIGDQQRAYASQFISLMRDKKEAQVKICGVATPADLNEPFLNDEDNLKRNAALRQIAKRRADKFKAFVINEGDLESSRLLVCSPKIDDKETAIPHIEIGI